MRGQKGLGPTDRMNKADLLPVEGGGGGGDGTKDRRKLGGRRTPFYSPLGVNKI